MCLPDYEIFCSIARLKCPSSLLTPVIVSPSYPGSSHSKNHWQLGGSRTGPHCESPEDWKMLDISVCEVNIRRGMGCWDQPRQTIVCSAMVPTPGTRKNLACVQTTIDPSYLLTYTDGSKLGVLSHHVLMMVPRWASYTLMC